MDKYTRPSSPETGPPTSPLRVRPIGYPVPSGGDVSLASFSHHTVATGPSTAAAPSHLLFSSHHPHSHGASSTHTGRYRKRLQDSLHSLASTSSGGAGASSRAPDALLSVSQLGPSSLPQLVKTTKTKKKKKGGSHGQVEAHSEVPLQALEEEYSRQKSMRRSRHASSSVEPSAWEPVDKDSLAAKHWEMTRSEILGNKVRDLGVSRSASMKITGGVETLVLRRWMQEAHERHCEKHGMSDRERKETLERDPLYAELANSQRKLKHFDPSSLLTIHPVGMCDFGDCTDVSVYKCEFCGNKEFCEKHFHVFHDVLDLGHHVGKMSRLPRCCQFRDCTEIGEVVCPKCNRAHCPRHHTLVHDVLRLSAHGGESCWESFFNR